jgi:cytochrome c oxidase assembly protein subunit 11
MSESLRQAHGKVARKLLLLTAGMFAFGFAMVPIYDVFCDITGLNGKTGRVSEAQSGRMAVDTERTITVEFVSTINGAAGPWEFRPAQARMQVNPGTLYKAHYLASNLSDAARVGRAVPSVAPAVAAKFFQKTQCFCFDKQDFAAQETREMPLTFVIDPRIPPGVDTVTLSYTFFNAEPA